MEPTPASLPLLQDVYDIGERMLAALEADDVETFSGLVQTRGELLGALMSGSSFGDDSEAWARLSGPFGQQFEALDQAMARLEGRMREDLTSLSKYKGARKSYAGTGMQGGILHRNVRG